MLELIAGLRDGSVPEPSRGPAMDGRLLPTIVAPGTNVSSALSHTAAAFTPIPGTGTPDPANAAVTVNQYTSQSGTSMSAPRVSEVFREVAACVALLDEPFVATVITAVVAAPL